MLTIPAIQRRVICGVVLAAVTVVTPSGNSQPAEPDVLPVQVRPAMFVWQIGIDSARGPNHAVGTILRATIDGRDVWRTTHYPRDPTDGTFDWYDVDAQTLLPVRSVMKTPTLLLDLRFADDHVLLQRTTNDQAETRKVPVKGRVRPEGPGLDVFVASLPLRIGYTTRYQLVERYGTDAGRTMSVTLSVESRHRLDVSGAVRDVYRLLIQPDDGAFQLREDVRAEPPHYPWRVEYRRGAAFVVSEVRTMAIE